MHFPVHGRSWAFTVATALLVACLAQATLAPAPAQPAKEKIDGPQKRAEALGIKFEKLKPAYLNWCNRSGKMLYTCGFSSKTKGRLGKDMITKQGYDAAKECAVDILRAAWDKHG